MASTINDASAQRRFYLCQAPRPDVWDDLAPTILKRLGKKNAIQTLEQSIELSSQRNPFIRKQGPGRKTTTEHAINFYEYLLEQAKEMDDWEEESEEEEVEVEPVEDSTQPTTEEKPSNASPIPKPPPTSKVEKPSTSENCVSLNTAEFSAQYNDICDICKGGGDLLLCRTCNLSFHMHCVRPVLENPPPQNWRCSYCILSTEPKHSKSRKAAAAAVRIMARLRNQHKRCQHQSEKDDEEESADRKEISVDEEDEKKELSTPITENKSSNEGDEGKSADNIIPETVTTSNTKKELDENDESEETPSSRSKRTRKQPTLYDPQVGPAGKWQTDELVLWKTRQGQEEDEESNEIESGDVGKADEGDSDGLNAVQASQKRRAEGQVCGFCGDDPDIGVCCFCACRVCFGKHHANQLLLCSRCEDEYHMFCLDPKLQRVPSNKWLCPVCDKNSSETRASRATISPQGPESASPGASTRSKISTTSRGRPIRSKSAHVEFVSDSKRPARSIEVSTTHAKKRSLSASPTERPRKRRGRKPVGSSLSPDQQPRSKGGRFASTTGDLSMKRKRGRPPSKGRDQRPRSPSVEDESDCISVVGETETEEDEESIQEEDEPSRNRRKTEQESDPVITSRSGRTVKRSNFHDEISEKDQHLRVVNPDRRGPGRPPNSSRTSKPFSRPVGRPTNRPGPGRPPNKKNAPKSAPKHVPVATRTSDVPDDDDNGNGNVDDMEKQENRSTAWSGEDAEEDSIPIDESLQAAIPNIPGLRPMEIGTPDTLIPTELSKHTSQQQAATKVEKTSAVDVMSGKTKENADTAPHTETSNADTNKLPRRKPGARECMQISRRFGTDVIDTRYMDILMDYCNRGKVEHLIRMRERLDDHARFLELQLAGLEAAIVQRTTGPPMKPVEIPAMMKVAPPAQSISPSKAPASKSTEPVKKPGDTELNSTPAQKPKIEQDIRK